MTARTSLTPAETADSWAKCRPVEPATSVARVVFPVPGGPYSNIEDGDAALDQPAQRRPGPEQVRLTGHLVQSAGPHPGGERGVPVHRTIRRPGSPPVASCDPVLRCGADREQTRLARTHPADATAPDVGEPHPDRAGHAGPLPCWDRQWH